MAPQNIQELLCRPDKRFHTALHRASKQEQPLRAAIKRETYDKHRHGKQTARPTTKGACQDASENVRFFSATTVPPERTAAETSAFFEPVFGRIRTGAQSWFMAAEG